MNDFVLRKEKFGGLLFNRITGSLQSVDVNTFNSIVESDTFQNKKVDVIINEDLVLNEKLYISAPTKVFLMITDYCNIHCKHCSVESDSSKNNYLSISDINSLLQQFRYLGVFEIAINGGEPMYHPDFFHIVRSVKSNGFLLNLNTSGIYTKDKAEKLAVADIDKIKVSLDGLKDKNDNMRGLGTFDIAMRTIKILIEKNKSVRINYTLTAENMRDCIDTVKLANDLGCGVKISPVAISGRAKKTGYSVIPINEGRTLCEKIMNMQINKTISVPVEIMVDLVENDCYKISKYNYQFGLCGRCSVHVSIDSTGMLYNTGCQTEFEVLGSSGHFTEAPIISLWQKGMSKIRLFQDSCKHSKKCINEELLHRSFNSQLCIDWYKKF